MGLDAQRLMIQYLQEQATLLRKIERHLAVMSGATEPEGETGVFYNLPSARTNELVALLVAASLPSAPETSIPVTVTTTETLLAANETVDLQVYWITNDSVAQPIWIGPKGVLVTSGRRIGPTDTEAFVLPPHSALYARCVVPTVSARISKGYPLAAIIGPYLDRR